MDVQNIQDLTNHVKFSSLKRYNGLLEEPDRNIYAKFKDLRAESFDFVQYSFKTDIGTTNSGAFALETVELQAGNEARINFHVFQDVVKL